MPYHGYSYPGLLDNRPTRWIWSRTFCRMGFHLWDEVHYPGSLTFCEPEENYLFCDACEAYFPNKEEEVRKCATRLCPNRSDEGVFDGPICMPCRLTLEGHHGTQPVTAHRILDSIYNKERLH